MHTMAPELRSLLFVPAGKSSILQAILNKMIVAKGNVAVGGTIAYVPQSPWVQNLSLRDNILFGMPYDEEKYMAVIHACALELDLKILPNGAHIDCVAVLYPGVTVAQAAAAAAAPMHCWQQSSAAYHWQQ
jgi:hypothetical protein